MIPGLQSKLSESNVASAATIVVKSDFARITGSTQIDTILTPLQGSPVIIHVAAVDGAVVISTSGNVLVGVTLTQNRVYTLIWSKLMGKWYIHSVA